MTSNNNNRSIVSGTAIQNIIGTPFDWCEVPAGQFIYGDDDKTSYREHSLPADKQTINLPTFAMAKYPITYRQFQVFVEDNEGFRNPRWWQGFAGDQSGDPVDARQKIADRPRDNVSWYDAMAFCRWLSHKLWAVGVSGEIPRQEHYDPMNLETWLVRLPTEFEWEKAARGTDGREYPWGNDFDKNKANTAESNLKQTSSVTRYAGGASPYGVFDLSGNVAEWCLSDLLNPQQRAELEDIGSDALRVVRGGSWFLKGKDCRATFRIDDPPDIRDDFGGFRIMTTTLTI